MMDGLLQVLSFGGGRCCWFSFSDGGSYIMIAGQSVDFARCSVLTAFPFLNDH